MFARNGTINAYDPDISFACSDNWDPKSDHLHNPSTDYWTNFTGTVPKKTNIVWPQVEEYEFIKIYKIDRGPLQHRTTLDDISNTVTVSGGPVTGLNAVSYTHLTLPTKRIV